MQNISRREKILLVCCVLVLICAAYLLLTPAGSQGNQRKLLTVAQAETQTRESQARSRQLATEQDALATRAAHWTYDRPAGDLAPEIVRDLQVIAQRAGVHLREVRPLQPRLLPSGQGTGLPMEVRFQADFQPDVVRFLYYVEDPSRKLSVVRLDITSAESGSRTDSHWKAVEVSARIMVYTRSLAGVTGGGEESSDVSESSSQGG